MRVMLPCPFCTGRNLKLERNRRNGKLDIFVRCTCCHARGGVVRGEPAYLTTLEDAAIELWNKRPPADEVVEIPENKVRFPAPAQNKSSVPDGGHHKGHKTVGGKFCTYTVYRSDNDEIVAYGTAEECAHMMGITYGSFRAMVSRALKGERKKYFVLKEYLDEEEEEDYES